MEIRCELDPGFQKGREFGYGLSGGQSIDDMRLKPHSERPREQFVPWRNRAECVQHASRTRAHTHTRTPHLAPPLHAFVTSIQVHPRQAPHGIHRRPLR